jgi:uncharacterized protein (DUF169 family)
MKTVAEYQEAGKRLFDLLHLATYPVGVTYIKSLDEIPAEAYRPTSNGRKMTLCQAFTQSRRWGTTMAMTTEDNFCTPSSAVHLWSNVTLDELIESQLRQGWHSGVEAERRRFARHAECLAGTDVEELREYLGFVCAPLHSVPLVPHSVVVYCNGEQLTHIIHALTYEYLHVPESSFEGFTESCAKGGFLPFATAKPQIVIPGAGDRTFAGIGENEVAIGLPADLVFYTLEHLFKTGGRMNIGHPLKQVIPMHLDENATPGFRYLRSKMK